MKHNSRKQRTIITITGLVIFLTIGLMICADFVMRTRSTTDSISKEIAEKEAEKSRSMIEYALKDQFSDIVFLADVASEYENFEDPKLLDFLESFGDVHYNSDMAVADLKGNCYMKGETKKFVGDTEYFTKVIQSGNQVVSELIPSVFGDRNVVILAVPIYRNGEIAGMLMNLFENEQLISLLNVSQMGIMEDNYLIQRDGTVVASNGKLNAGDDFGTLFPADFVEKQRNVISGKMGEQERGNFLFEVHNVSYYCNYVPVSGTEWYLFCTSTIEGLSSYTRQSTMLGIILMVKMSVLLVIICSSIFIWSLLNNKRIHGLTAVLENVTSNSPGGMIRFNLENMNLTFVNCNFYKLARCTSHEFEETYHNNFAAFVYEEDRETILAQIKANNQAGKEYHMRYRLRTYTGEIYWVLQVNNVYEDNGKMEVYGLIVDIDEYKDIEDELFLSNQRYKIIVNQMESCFIEFDIKTMAPVEVENYEEMFGMPLEIRTDTLGVTEEDREMVREKLQRITSGKTSYEEYEARLQKSDGSYLWCLLRYYSMVDETGDVSRVICKITNIDKRKRHTAELENRARKDALTDLFNKVVTEEKIKSFLDSMPDNIQAMFVIDMDDFKGINDTMGHSAGDRVLKYMSHTLQTLFRKSDILGRIGGDEFLVLMKDCSDEKHALNKAKQISNEFINNAKDENIMVSCSVGVALYPKHGRNFSELFKAADQALYQAKGSGKSRVVVHLDENNITQGR